MMKKTIFLLFLLSSAILLSQNDCKDAITVCGNSGYSDLIVSGFGAQELSGSNTCSSKENNSIWFKLHIKTTGTLGFTLTPVNKDINEDFDFFIFPSTATCSNLGTAIRCSTTNPKSSGQANNLTGMNETETDTSEGPGPSGNSFVKWLNVNAGESYFLVIDRPVGKSNFNLTWTGTATFFDQPIIDKTILPDNTLDINKCDNDGLNDNITDFNLTQNDAIIGTQTNIDVTYHLSNNDAILGINSITTPHAYRNINSPQSIFIRLTNKLTECFITDSFSLNINPMLNNDDIIIVDDTNNNDLDIYSIKITSGNKKITINDYEFVIINEDNFQTNFQDNPLFENITGGFYTIVVNGKNGCLTNFKIEVSVIQYPKFFTPNGDGNNDTWRIRGANSSFYPSSNITIVNRYGKIVAIVPINNLGWDGTYKGKKLPSNDYWFKTELVDRKGKIHQHNGHFSLLRR